MGEVDVERLVGDEEGHVICSSNRIQTKGSEQSNIDLRQRCHRNSVTHLCCGPRAANDRCRFGCERAHCSTRSACFRWASSRTTWSAGGAPDLPRVQPNFLNQINLMLRVQPHPNKHIPFAVGQIIAIISPIHPGKRGVSRSSRTRGWMRWTQRRRARSWSQGGLSRERSNVGQTTGASRPSPELQSVFRRSELR
jgi:hypothetical protein